MPDVLGSLPALQAQLVEDVGRIGRARLAVPALRRGARRVLFLDADHEVVVRDEPKGEGGGAAITVFSRDGADTARDVFGLPDGSWRDVLSDGRLDVHGGSASVSLPALTAAVYVREGSPCLP